jgi:hypothetical protein
MAREFVLAKSTLPPHRQEVTRRLALTELRMLLAAMVMKYTWSGVPDKKGRWDEEMKPFEMLLIYPRKHRCVLKLELRD